VKQEKPAITIGTINITKDEFNKALARYNFDIEPTKETRRTFLDNFINRKLILKEAEKEGLDKKEQFLADVQDFYEQALIKFIFDKKIKELFVSLEIKDAEINSFYNANKDKFGAKDLSSSYADIKMLLLKEKQKKAINDWLDSLRKKTSVKIDYKLLDLE
jgi:hypothetical protein